MMRREILVAGLLLLASATAPAMAQSYPSKPIKLVVPFTPGSPNDVLARLITQDMTARLGQPVVIENRPGAGTTIGSKAVAAADPDGYTLLLAATSFILSTSLYTNPGFDPIKNFAPVAFLVHSPQVLVIDARVPAKSVAEFVVYVRANPGKLNFGFGLGTLPQILGESFKAINGLDIASIPYKGGAQAITDMLGGRIQMNFGTLSTLLPLIEQGKIRALAVTTDTRAPSLPNVPTMMESGLPQLSVGFTGGILAPAGTPAAIIDRLNTAINDGLNSPAMEASLAKLGFYPKPQTPQQYAAFLAEEAKVWPPIVKAAGIKPE
jgi:tripartite-type tricarboxylate transporter receptor subunit TctC